MAVDLNFILTRYLPLTTELSRLLGETFTPGTKAQASQIGQAVALIIRRQNEGDFQGREIHFRRMVDLVDQLRLLEHGNPDAFRSYRKKLLDSDVGNFFGTRFEIFIAALLVDKAIAFRHRSQGGPDLVAQGAFAGAGIECASGNLPDQEKGPFAMQKLAGIVRTKSGKPYCSTDNVLAIDVTNLHAAVRDSGGTPFHHQSKDLRDMADASGFGSVVIFWTQHNVQDDGTFERHHRFERFDAAACAVAVNALLDDLLGDSYHVTDTDDWRVPFWT